MTGRDQKIYEEAADLWRRLYGESPPRGADGARLLDMILGRQPDASYGRLISPHLRASNITFPKSEGA